MWDVAQIITMNCVGKCPYCMYGSKLNSVEEVPLDDLLAFYSQIKGPLCIKITGGEPLQPNNVSRTLSFIAGLKQRTNLFDYQVNTNGAWGIPVSLLSDPRCNIQVSCDGPAEYQNACYGQEYYSTLLNTLSLFKKATARGHIMMVVTNETKKYVDYCAQLAYTNNMEFKTQWVSPVDLAAAQTVENRFTVMKQIDRRYGLARQPAVFCGHRHSTPDDMYLCITATGELVNCPITSAVKTGLTIYNCTPQQPEKIISGINSAMADKTCQYPMGVRQAILAMSKQQLQSFSKHITPQDKEDLKNVFGIDL